MFVQEVNISNVTLKDCNFTGTDPTSLFFFLMLDNGKIDASGLSIVNTKVGYRSGFEPYPLGSLELSMSDLYFENVTLNTDASLVKTGLVNSFTLQDSTFIDVKQVIENDNSNTMIELGTLNLDSGNDFILANLTAQQSSITLVKMNNLKVSGNSTNQVLISDIVYKDSVFEFHQDLISVGNIEQEYAFEIIMSNIEMFNLTFTRTGDLMHLQHQTFSGIQLLDSSFYDINGGSIHVISGNKQSTSLKTKLRVSNIKVEHIRGRASPFIISRFGSEMTIEDSMFINSYNLEGGSIILSQDQRAVVLVFNCTFQNNAALYGGVVDIQEQGTIKFYNSTFINNFAVMAGVVKVGGDGCVEIYD